MLTGTSQIHQENLNWLSLLEYYQNENAVQKNSLAAVLERKIDSSGLEKAEYFQNEFLKKDEIINILRNDILRQENLLSLGHDRVVTQGEQGIFKRQEYLRNGMHFLEMEIADLKESFEHYRLSKP